MLTQAVVMSLLEYDEITGIFKWKNTTACHEAGDVAGSPMDNGYVRICVGSWYLAHRLAFLWMEGYLPENTVDHVDRVRANNAWKNLREVSYQCQVRNQGRAKCNRSGVKGVIWEKRRARWMAFIKVAGKFRNLGCSDSKLEACFLRYAAEQCLGFSDCDKNSSALQYIKEKRY